MTDAEKKRIAKRLKDEHGEIMWRCHRYVPDDKGEPCQNDGDLNPIESEVCRACGGSRKQGLYSAVQLIRMNDGGISVEDIDSLDMLALGVLNHTMLLTPYLEGGKQSKKAGISTHTPYGGGDPYRGGE
jgi:hypothetical protein